MPEHSLQDQLARVARLETHKGPLALETTAARHDLAGALHRAGRLAEAEAQYRRACEGFAHSRGPTHLFTLTCMNNLALVLRDRRDWQSALDLLAAVHRQRAATLGPEHPLTLNAANNFLGVQILQGDLAAAVREYPALLAACEATFGPDAPDTHAVRTDYAHVLRRLGREREALEQVDADVHPVAEVLLGCARLLRYTGLFPVALTASRHGARLELGTHGTARTEHLPGETLHDEDLDIACHVVGPDDLEAPYDEDLDLLAPADQVADAVGALAEHLARADRELGGQRLRVRVFVHHEQWPLLSAPPSLTVDRRLMPRRDQVRHDRLMSATAHLPVPHPRAPRRGLRHAPGFSVRLAGGPQVTVSTAIGLEGRPAPSPFEA
ncbi:tetratricopeptide repeat protein [Streptomyces sp. NPDC058739]|uniref:tetratricopeptide repeat protein n=1 Tax=Streptomyces sp. NPDC058739 TaxID=3346618 RepID=UPI003688ED6B